ncbi:MAG: S9 family peptidase [Acidobacteria bacterium]|nr:S9 family peptidase [Acidobacteriota bacterium]
MRSPLLALLLPAALAASGFTIEQVMSAPFPYDLTASRDGRHVAWVVNECGARNVYVASAPDFRGSRLTNYQGDDGTDAGQLAWLPDGSGVVYTRGGDLEFLGRPDPNPSTDVNGTEQAIWLAAPGKAPRKIASGHSPAVSPKGDRMVYLSGGMLWLVALEGNANPEPLYRPRSGVTAADPRWSPDGSKLAFVSDRTNHAFIAVYDFAAKNITYLDPTVDRDSNPAWSPDSRHVAFTRMAGGGGGRGGRGGVSATPWAIRVADASTGEGRALWQADRGTGSAFHPLEAAQQIVWTGGGRIVFPWEKDGWSHLYSIPAEGGSATLLTPGEFEVEHWTPAADGGEIVYSSNQDDIDRRHIWRVSTTAGAPRAVTAGENLEWQPAPVAGGFAFLEAGTKEPARAVVQLGGSAARDIAPGTVPADFPTNSLVVPQQVIYSASDGMQIHGQLFLPAGLKPGEKRKAIVFMHGGSRRQMLLGWHYMDYYNHAYAMNQYLAGQGYIVLSINYRSGIGYGQAFREPANYGANGASEFHDVEGAGLYLRSRPDVDGAHIGLWGGSYGGYLTALGLARDSALFAAGVDFHGVHDWSARQNPNSAAPAVQTDATRTAFESSPMAAVSTWKSPVLLIHGDDDRNVQFSETVTLANALRRQGVYFEQLIIPDEIHGFLRHQSWLKGYAATADFFRRKL